MKLTTLFNNTIFNLNLSNMKQKFMKQGLITLALVVGITAMAQTTNVDNITKQTEAVLGGETTTVEAIPDTNDPNTVAPQSGATTQGGHIRLIDNKGTRKYLQVQNGLTQVTDLATDGGVVTTWQLGGQFVDDTEFDLNGNDFVLENVLQVDATDTTAGVPATTVSLRSDDATATTGWTILVRDEATGGVKKMLASDLIVSGQTIFEATVATDGSATTAELTFDVTAGTPAMAGAQIPLPEFEKVWVYRNGAKLLAGVDYTISGDTVILDETPSIGDTWTLYDGDVIEVQYIK